MGNQIKHRRLFRLATSWLLAVVLTGGSMPVPALQELFGTATAYAEEQQSKESTLEVDEKDSSQDSARENVVGESQQDQNDVPTILEVSNPAEKDAITEEDETSESEEPIMVLATEGDAERILTTQNGSEDDPSISFEGDVPNCLVVTDASDSVDLTLSTLNTQGLNIRWTVGLCVVDDWVNEHIFVENREYSVDQLTNTITLNGAKVLEHLGGYGEGSDPNRLHVRIFAEAIDPSDPDGNPVAANATTWVDFFEPYVDYQEQGERDRSMLPNWNGDVYRWYTARVWDEEHPNGDNQSYEVTNVEVVQNPSTEGEDVVELERREWPDGDGIDHNWHYEAKNFGTATFTVTCRMVDTGEIGSYDFTVTVAPDVYGITVAGDPDDDNILPGESVRLTAEGTHYSAVKHTDNEGTWYEQQETTEGLNYYWELQKGGDAGTLNPDGQHVTFTAKTPGPGRMGFDDEVLVRACLHDGNVETTDPVADRGWTFNVRNTFVEPHPVSINSQLQVGKSEDIDLKLLHRTWGEDDEAIDDAEFFFCYDTNCVNVKDANGNAAVDNSDHGDDEQVPCSSGTYTITRKGDWDTGINVKAVWYEGEDHNERHEYDREWRLDRLDYKLMLNGEHDLDVWVTNNDDGTYSNPKDASNTVELSDDLRSLVEQGAKVEWVVGKWENDEYTETYGEDSGLYSVSEDGLTITSSAAKMAAMNVRDLRITAKVTITDDMMCESEGDFWFHLQEREQRYEFEGHRDLLPGWDGEVDRQFHAWARDEDHPDGQDYDINVTGVEVIDGAEHIEFDEDSWYYRAKELGAAKLKVTYKVPENLGGGEGTYELKLNVATDVYGVNVGVCEGDSWGLPGESVKLEAHGWHCYLNDDGREQGTDTTKDNDLHFAWRLGDDTYGSLANETGTKNTVTFKSADELGDLGGDERGVQVEVRLYDGDEGVAYDDEIVSVNDDYPTVTPYPADFPFRTPVGDTIQVTPTQLWRSIGDDGKVHQDDISDDTQFKLCFDARAISVAEDDGLNIWTEDSSACHVEWTGKKTLSLTRLENWGTELYLDTEWGDDSERCDDHRQWKFEELDYSLRFQNEDSDVWVTRKDDDCITDATDATVALEQGDDLDKDGNVTLDFAVGTGEWDEDAFAWENDYDDRSGVYDVFVKDGTTTIKVYGSKLARENVDELHVKARAVKDGKELCQPENEWRVHLHEREARYEHEENRDLLPGWDGTVDNRFNMWVSDEDHPEGEDFECIVTSVEVTTGADLIDFDSSTWHYRAKELGTAMLKVTYQLPDGLGGGTGTYDLKLNIVADEYHFEGLGTQRHGGFILPGETADVWLQGYHQHAVKNDDGSWRIEESTDDLAYEWEMVPSRPEYDDIATMTVDENDPTHVTITAIVLEPEPRPGAGVTVSAHLKHDGEGVARAGWTINICDSFPDFEPATIDCDLGVGESTTIDTKLMWRELHDDGEIVSEPFEPEGLQLFWSYDTDAVLITDAEGNVVTNSEWGGNDTPAGEGPYTVTRLNDAEAMLCLMARWPEGENTMDYEAQYRFVAARDVTAHKLEHVAAKTATLSATGHGEHWKCKVCGKFFLDEDATQATTLKDLTIAKLTNISTATVTFPARTYNGNEQTMLPVVKIGDHTLVKGTDYTVTGTTKATNAGTYEVTITGIGAYGGSRKVSYTVAKAASSISLAPQTKTYTGGALTYSGTVTKKGSTGAVSYAYYSDAACTKAVAAANVKGAGTYYVKGTVKADANHNAATSAEPAKFTVAPKAQTLSAANKSVVMGKTVSLGAKVTEGAGALSYKSSSTAIAKVSAKGIVTPVKVGSTTITVTAAAKGSYKSTSKTIKVTVTKGTQPIAVKALTAKVALSKVKKANQTLAVSKVLIVTKAQGAVTYAKTSGNAKITVNSKTGAVTVKKGLGKGTYPVKVQVKAAGNANWKAGTKTVTFYVSVK
ncbi:MAG: hypothetical protein IKF14_16825 [Atopobiaceae bacterium]|nr:hypothetical protein [Atopobiaceae bacterium]